VSVARWLVLAYLAVGAVWMIVRRQFVFDSADEGFRNSVLQVGGDEVEPSGFALAVIIVFSAPLDLLIWPANEWRYWRARAALKGSCS
jgi:hypothetical protein